MAWSPPRFSLGPGKTLFNEYLVNYTVHFGKGKKASQLMGQVKVVALNTTHAKTKVMKMAVSSEPHATKVELSHPVFVRNIEPKHGAVMRLNTMNEEESSISSHDLNTLTIEK